MDNTPSVIEETDDFAVIYKPPKMHCAVLKKEANDHKEVTLHEWYSRRGSGYCDLLHRLDFETHGLVLFARNKKSFEFFKNLQEKGGFIKEYSAVSEKSFKTPEGFPSPPEYEIFTPSVNNPVIIASYFRPYGQGRKLVRPAVEYKKNRDIARDNGGFYRTEIINVNGGNFKARIKRGFRHQIRCHLCWIGFPILNDPLYSNSAAEGQFLALRAHSLIFTNPSNGGMREYSIPALEKIPF